MCKNKKNIQVSVTGMITLLFGVIFTRLMQNESALNYIYSITGSGPEENIIADVLEIFTFILFLVSGFFNLRYLIQHRRKQSIQIYSSSILNWAVFCKIIIGYYPLVFAIHQFRGKKKISGRSVIGDRNIPDNSDT